MTFDQTESAKVLDTEACLYERGVKKAIYIRAHMPSLNKDGGHHQLSSLWMNTLRAYLQPGPPVLTTSPDTMSLSSGDQAFW